MFQRSIEDLEYFVHKITFNFTSTMSLSSAGYWDIGPLAEAPPSCQPVALICAINFALIGAIKAPIAHPTAQSYHRLLLGSFTHFQIDCNTNLSSSEGITTKKSPIKTLQDGGLSMRQWLLYIFQWQQDPHKFDKSSRELKWSHCSFNSTRALAPQTSRTSGRVPKNWFPQWLICSQDGLHFTRILLLQYAGYLPNIVVFTFSVVGKIATNSNSIKTQSLPWSLRFHRDSQIHNSCFLQQLENPQNMIWTRDILQTIFDWESQSQSHTEGNLSWPPEGSKTLPNRKERSQARLPPREGASTETVDRKFL